MILDNWGMWHILYLTFNKVNTNNTKRYCHLILRGNIFYLYSTMGNYVIINIDINRYMLIIDLYKILIGGSYEKNL